MEDSRARVIIVGAGPVGLYMAHALQKASIDFVILEQHSTPLSLAGQVLFIWPQTVRLFDQIGLMGPLQEAAIELHKKKRICGTDGRVMTCSNFWDNMRENHGYPFLPVLRSDVVRILYENLEGSDTRIITNAQVVDIEIHDSSVDVKLKDGTIVNGSFVIGADGVHSHTRRLMQKVERQSTKLSAQDVMIPSFYGIFGQASNLDLQIEPEVLLESRGAGTVIQCIATKANVHFVSLTPRPQDELRHNTKYTKEAMETYATSISDVKICPGVTFADMWKRADKTRAVMVNQEEGFLDSWFHDRIVLVGNAVHKTTSVNGLGMNCGVHSAAALANEIRNLEDSSTAQLRDAFARYQQNREAECRVIWSQGYKTIREVTKRSWINWAWDTYVLPWVDIESFAKGILVSLLLIRHGQILSYVPFDSKQGRISWTR
ncbi:FAD/NAD(P)-binding domain-containing protein [Xylaria sp. FL0933]|nr:FAD/NAD(P)-binding domain-containing protein [Xylaria sp. FL0933]